LQPSARRIVEDDISPGSYIVSTIFSCFRVTLTLIVTCGMLSGLYLSAMSVDRLIAVRFPMAAPGLCNPSRAKKVVAIGSLIVIGANMNLPYTLKYVKHPETGDNTILHSNNAQ
jgi:hypothetical protein